MFAVAAGGAAGAATAGARQTAPTNAQIQAAVVRAKQSDTLWATVNICDTRRYPDTLGVRGQMPSLGFSSSMSIDIQVSYYSTTKHRFVPVPHEMLKISLGQHATGLEQGGWNFPFAAHAGLLNATLTFVWTRGGRALGQTQRQTTAGHPGADFGSPPHFSAKQCRMS